MTGILARALAATAFSLSLLLQTAALAATTGFVEDFDSDNGGFAASFGQVIVVVPTGGVDNGPYLDISDNTGVNFLGAVSSSPELVGNYPLDGVTGFSFYVRRNDPNVEVHITVGNTLNAWQSTAGFRPPLGSWTRYEVDTTTSAGWTQIIALAPDPTFANAVAGATIVLFRHDVPPFVQTPPVIASAFSIDRITVLPAPEPSASSLAFAALAALAGIQRAKRAQ